MGNHKVGAGAFIQNHNKMGDANVICIILYGGDGWTD